MGSCQKHRRLKISFSVIDGFLPEGGIQNSFPAQRFFLRRVVWAVGDTSVNIMPFLQVFQNDSPAAIQRAE